MVRVLWPLLVLVAVLGGGWLYGQGQYRAGQAAQREQDVHAQWHAFQQESERLAALSSALADRIDTLAALRPPLIERYTHEIRQTPLPSDCVIDAGRMQHLNAALAAANAALTADEPVRPVPADSDADDGCLGCAGAGAY